MYLTVLAIHNIFRWIVLILGVITLLRAYLGWLGGRIWTSTDRTVSMLFASSLDIQLLLGLILYFFLSPITREFINDIGAAMADVQTRFFGLEHVLYMLAAVVLVHVGSARARRAETDVVKFRFAAIFFSLAFIVILIAIPWWRPLIRGF